MFAKESTHTFKERGIYGDTVGGFFGVYIVGGHCAGPLSLFLSE